MEYYALTGLTTGQLHKLGLLVMQEIGSLVRAGAKSRRRSGCSTRWSWSQCRLLQHGRQVSPDEFVILVVPLVLYGE